MKILKTETTETVVTLELTLKELNTLVCGMGASAGGDREDVAKKHNLAIVETSPSHQFYKEVLEKTKALNWGVNQ